MADKKSWTVMVYLAADNNLANFGVDSLRQMKAAASNGINVVAEFDTGPMNKSKRYLFDGKAPFGPLETSEIDSFPPTNAGDPRNLEDFIVWTANRYPADHYFVIIWGHGAGVDDGISQAPDNSFVPRHRLLSLFKGILNIPLKGILNIPLKGILNIPLKGVSALSALGILDIANNQALENGFEAIYQDIISAAKKVIDTILSKPEFPGQPAMGQSLLLEIKSIIDEDLRKNGASLKNGPLAALQGNVLAALQKGFLEALQSGTLDQLQREILDIRCKYDLPASGDNTFAIPPHDLDRLHAILCDGFLLTLQNSILEAMQMGILDPSQSGTGTKSLAFVDHPTSFMTNAQLKMALRRAVRKIGSKIDILGMDACNMNMIEIGYELRDSVSLMVASQDDIPDASWPYDRILNQLAEQQNLTAKELAAGTAEKYVEAYQDYGDQPVTLSVLDLEFCPEIEDLVMKLTAALEKAAKTFKGQQAISDARRQVRSFGQDQFVDLIHFCQLLTKGTSSLADLADKALAPLEFPFILADQASTSEENCNGTSIYFPQSTPSKASHLETLRLYADLDFAKMTAWGDFLTRFLKETTVETPAEVSDKHAPPEYEKPPADPPPVPVGGNGSH
ncbi:MAG TPA: clostripain-related cysteine peptidase [Candidatus Angelobacter sp.]